MRSVIAWLCPYRFPAWREVYRRTAAAADVLIVRLQAGNPLGLVSAGVDNGDPLFAGKRLIVFESSARWTASTWRQELCDCARNVIGDGDATILQLDEDELLSREEVAADLSRLELEQLGSIWYRFQGPLPAADDFFASRIAGRITYPAAPHCKMWTWFAGASFTVPKYQGYASPCGIPKQPSGTKHVLSIARIRHLLLATAELRRGRRDLFTKYLARANRMDLIDAATRGESASVPDWITQIVGV